MIQKRRIVLITLIILILFVIITNYYFIAILNNNESEVRRSKLTIEELILHKLPLIVDKYKKKFTAFNDNTTDTFFANLKIKKINLEELWKEAGSGVSKLQLYNISSPYLGTLLHALQTTRIVKADIDTRGTQLKLLLTLEGGQEVVFKPKWYPIDRIIVGPVYSGKDRYFSEIVAFYLSAILEKPFVPPVAERKLSLRKDIIPVATEQLRKTIFEFKSSICVYGKCFYCKKEDPICADSTGTITGALMYNVNASFKNYRSPWLRTYKKGKTAIWEMDNNYCKTIKSKLPIQHLLNLIDTSIFDFLMQNGDRHHYETLGDTVVLIDNGKGLGNPNVNHLDILAPLYQCCILKNSTWRRLEQLSGGFLLDKLQRIPDVDTLLTVEHLNSMEKRLMIVYATVEYCRTRNKIEHFLF